LFSTLFIFNFTMKKPSTPKEKPAPKSKTEQPVAAVASEAKAKKASPTEKTPNKPKAVAPKPMTEAKAQQPAAVAAAEATSIKPSQISESPKKAQTVAPKPVEVMPEMTLPGRVGLTAGSIWHYLSENGSTSVRLNWFGNFRKKKRSSNAASAGWPRKAK
jgi:hypothetical protein